MQRSTSGITQAQENHQCLVVNFFPFIDLFGKKMQVAAHAGQLIFFDAAVFCRKACPVDITQNAFHGYTGWMRMFFIRLPQNMICRKVVSYYTVKPQQPDQTVVHVQGSLAGILLSQGLIIFFAIAAIAGWLPVR